MAASSSGIVTLLALLLAGPLAWTIIELTCKTRRRSKHAESSSTPGQSATGEVVEREQVDGLSYLVGLIGWAIGLGNIWRFPYLVGRWGGGAFVVAYLVCLFTVAMPAFMIELAMGQYTRSNTIDCFNMIHPRWTGLGYGQVMLLLLWLIYFNMLLAYSIIYLVGSLSSPLPWADNSAEYWQRIVHNGIGDPDSVALGPIEWRLVVAILFVWVVVFLSVAFGKEMLAKVTWVAVVGPVGMVLILLVRAVTLDGSKDGLRFYLGKFDAEVLGNLDMWAAACGQIIYSLGVAFGTGITLSSYARPNQNVFRTCAIVAFSNSTFSLMGGVAIFAMLGNITYRINSEGGIRDEATGLLVLTTVEDQARSGTGLAFITIADGMRSFGSGTNVMSVLFFMTLFSLGLDSTFAVVETFVAYVDDFLQARSKLKPRRSIIVGSTCCVFFLLSLFYCTARGIDLLDIVDHYVANYFLLFGVAVEALLFTVDFGWRRMEIHVKLSTFGNPETPLGQDMVPSLLWRLAIPITVPLLSLSLLAYTLHSDLTEAYQGYPIWLRTIGWTLLLLCVVMAPAGWLWHCRVQRRGRLGPLAGDEARLAEALREIATTFESRVL